ncbi:NinE family protein [Serratia fonticola]|nr:NinE family protein [Serratia fonticola]
MARARRSATQIAIDNLIFRTKSKSPRKPKLSPADIPTYDAVWPLLQSRFNRVRRTR